MEKQFIKYKVNQILKNARFLYWHNQGLQTMATAVIMYPIPQKYLYPHFSVGGILAFYFYFCKTSFGDLTKI